MGSFFCYSIFRLASTHGWTLVFHFVSRLCIANSGGQVEWTQSQTRKKHNIFGGIHQRCRLRCDLPFFPDKFAEAESLLHNREKAANRIGFDVNAYKTELMCIHQYVSINSFISKPLRAFDQFINLVSNISPSKTYVDKS